MTLLRERADNFALALLRLGVRRPTAVQLLRVHLRAGRDMARQSVRKAFQSVCAAALGLAFPLPCGDATICWQAWDSPVDTTRVEIRSGGVTCQTLPASVGRRRTTNAMSWWPRDTAACPLTEAMSRWYSVRACNAFGCSPDSEAIEWIGQPQAEIHMTATGPCEWGGSLTRLPRCL